MLHFSYTKHILQFNFDARTSRGVIKEHAVFLIEVCDVLKPTVKGVGEASPLPGLSVDDVPDFEKQLTTFLNNLNEGVPLDVLDFRSYPSVKFALETALADLKFGSKGKIFESDFLNGKQIPINGLVWMADKETMLKSVDEKVAEGFTCIKLKVGALDFDEECRMLETIRKKYSAFKIELRVDANGAFKPDEALEQLSILSRFELHSIEQPIKPKQVEWMQELCSKSKLAIALDEELIGVDAEKEGQNLLKFIKPQYLILKPTLLGGFANCNRWVEHARSQNNGWWATSALESNVGLNAIAQWVSTKATIMPQGLGTGSLYTNNFPSPLFIKKGFLGFSQNPAFSF